MMKTSGRLRQTSTQSPAGTLISLLARDPQQGEHEPEGEREDHRDRRDLKVDEEALEQEPEVVPGRQPFPVVGIDEIFHQPALIA